MCNISSVAFECSYYNYTWFTLWTLKNPGICQSQFFALCSFLLSAIFCFLALCNFLQFFCSLQFFALSGSLKFPACISNSEVSVRVKLNLKMIGARLPLGLNLRQFQIHGRLCGASMHNAQRRSAVALGPAKSRHCDWQTVASKELDRRPT